MGARVRTGLDVLLGEGCRRLLGRRVGLLAHQASIDSSIRHVLPLFHAAGVKLAALFGPEHGITGAAQDMETVEGVAGERDQLTGAPSYSLYGATEDSLAPRPEMLDGLDVLVIDLQDVGARYYTYAATMAYAMRVASGRGIEIMVLDRPNPLGGRSEDVEGPRIEPGFFSFVGAFDMAIRHGLTIGEYAQYVRAQQGWDVPLTIVKMEGWRRELAFEDTGLPWVMPSPNMPSNDTAFIYPGQCLIEGTNLSEGRGTTRPFELCGAPYLEGAAWAQAAAPHVGPGYVLRPTVIKPTFQKHGGKTCGAIQVHVTDRWAARSLRLSTALMITARSLAPSGFDWRRERYEFVSDRLAIDLLYGSSRPRVMIESGASTDDVIASFAEDEREFREQRRAHLLYG